MPEAADEVVHPSVEVDPTAIDNTDPDSTYDEATLESTQSLSSSIFDYEEVHGRTYHAYHNGKYWLPNDADEMERIDIMYHAYRLAMGDKLHYAPIDQDPSAVLDVGTGTGLWALDFADEYPSAQVIATDLSPIQPAWVPNNLEFQIADSDEPWTFGAKFDLIHTRLMYDCSLRSWPHFFSEAYKALKPGGWVECQEFSHHRMSDDNSIPVGSRITHWENLWTEGMQRIGLGGTVNVERLVGQMKEAGLQDVTCTMFKLPIGPWPKDLLLKEAGKLGYANLDNALYGVSVKLFTEALGWGIDELHALVAECRKELKRRNVHAYWPLYIVMGRKPVT
ncbi:hypothetical protein H2198_007294 [Neophaeococcomyces mojaviensis]|uniref:Uncharacterized protein n=1 Tax=Neophaeococcomyces mojaviensis TaxID=3383035 RepID=A0ACC3A0C7_9EURO|nr:hypothetical protein H2198_007294 [Knufia sp. JES_112]